MWPEVSNPALKRPAAKPPKVSNPLLKRHAGELSNVSNPLLKGRAGMLPKVSDLVLKRHAGELFKVLNPVLTMQVGEPPKVSNPELKRQARSHEPFSQKPSWRAAKVSNFVINWKAREPPSKLSPTSKRKVYPRNRSTSKKRPSKRAQRLLNLRLTLKSKRTMRTKPESLSFSKSPKGLSTKRRALLISPTRFTRATSSLTRSLPTAFHLSCLP